MVRWVKTKFPGVRYWESDVRDSSGKLHKKVGKGKKWKSDKCYTIRYQRDGKTVTETVGWESKGVTAQFCSNLQGKIDTNIKTGGEGYHSLKEKSARERAKKSADSNLPLESVGQTESPGKARQPWWKFWS